MVKKFISILLSIILLTSCNFTISNKIINNNLNLQKDILKVYTLDVEQAESILIQFKDKNILIDAGNNSDEERIVNYLKNLGVNKIHIAIATHPDADHIGGMDSVIKNFEIEKFFITKDEKDTKTFKDVITNLEQKKVNVVELTKDEQIKFDNVILDIFAPTKYYEDVNNNSIVSKLAYGEFEMLFTGDMEIEQEMDLLAKNIDLDVDILKVGHHGSKTSTSNELLLKTTPEYAIISSGEGNKYGHPHKETIDKLLKNDIEIYRTDEKGTIIVQTDGENINISFKDIEKETTNSANYIGNKNSKVYHLSNCSSLPKKENQVIFKNKNEAKQKGFKPCSICKP